MIQDFWLGVLATSTLALGLLVGVGIVGAVASFRYLTRFVAIQLHKDPLDGRFTAQVEVRPTPEVIVQVPGE